MRITFAGERRAGEIAVGAAVSSAIRQSMFRRCAAGKQIMMPAPENEFEDQANVQRQMISFPVSPKCGMAADVYASYKCVPAATGWESTGASSSKIYEKFKCLTPRFSQGLHARGPRRLRPGPSATRHRIGGRRVEFQLQRHARVRRARSR